MAVVVMMMKKIVGATHLRLRPRLRRHKPSRLDYSKRGINSLIPQAYRRPARLANLLGGYVFACLCFG